MKRELGDRVWPGFAAAPIPAILYNERFEFVVGVEAPPEEWERVPPEPGAPAGPLVFRRPAEKSEGFAVRLGNAWAGSLGTYDRVNRIGVEAMRSQLPPESRDRIRDDLVTVAPDLHAVALLHEMFHAFQATRAPARFDRAMRTYADEARYPFDDEAFAAAWDRESSFLAEALRSREDREACARLGREFLEARAARRAAAALGKGPLDFEREIEWLEGLGKYVELRFHALAAEEKIRSDAIEFRPGLAHWSMEFARLDGHLGKAKGDFRFYLSGMAIAHLLDCFAPGWKSRALDDGIYLDDLLREALDGTPR